MLKLLRYWRLIALIILVGIAVIFWLLLSDKRSRQASQEEIVYRPEKTIQIIEGWTNDDIAVYLAKQMAWSETEVSLVLSSPSEAWREKFSFLGELGPSTSLEGYLFPDTYRVYASSSVEEVIFKMLDNFDGKLDDRLRREISRQGRTIEEVIIMASLIEKEAPLNNAGGENRDARLVAGIFWDRLKIGQALQADATLSYILNDNKPSHSGQELEINSPYNTYKYPGLPPGPIANPGLVAIEAAVYPLYSDYNYFLTDAQGRIFYARTYQEHLQNKYQYLK